MGILACAGCTDVDDALSVRWLEDGRLEVGVHIADVSHFVAQVQASQACMRSHTLRDEEYSLLIEHFEENW